jgi:hypothetical protein
VNEFSENYRPPAAALNAEPTALFATSGRRIALSCELAALLSAISILASGVPFTPGLWFPAGGIVFWLMCSSWVLRAPSRQRSQRFAVRLRDVAVAIGLATATLCALFVTTLFLVLVLPD